jgi:hypothetical protein
MHWQSAPAGQQAKAKKASKTKFTCPDCGQNAWAKPDALLGCYACYEETEELVLMLAEPSDEETPNDSYPINHRGSFATEDEASEFAATRDLLDGITSR